jgi:DNA-binding XRE family transcriptional regulator
MISEQNLYKIVGERLAAKRNQLGITQDAMAEQVGLLRTSITNIEAGRQKAPLHVLFRLCDILSIELSSILPNNKELTKNYTVSLDVDGSQEDLPISINGEHENVSQDTYKTIEKLMKKIK